MWRSLSWLLVAACGSFADAEPPADAGSPSNEASTDGDASTTPAKLVFVTIAPMKIGAGFISEADKLCQSEASAAGRTGTFAAWLSTPDRPAVAQLPSSGRWATSAGDAVFDDVGSVTASQLRHTIDRHASGAAVVPTNVRTWTNTGAGGLVHSGDSTKTCQGFSSSNGGLTGAVGTPAQATDLRWTNAGAASCDSSLRVICFEK